jgi:hypothetical protein
MGADEENPRGPRASRLPASGGPWQNFGAQNPGMGFPWGAPAVVLVQRGAVAGPTVEAEKPARCRSTHAQKPRCGFWGCRKAQDRGEAQSPHKWPLGVGGRLSPRGRAKTAADAGHPGQGAGTPLLAAEEASDWLPRPALGNQIQRTWYRIYPRNSLP